VRRGRGGGALLVASATLPRRPTLALERRCARRGFARVAGVDEAGRGPLAGPVVASAVVIGDPRRLVGVRDSKQLTPFERERLFPVILAAARAVGIGVASAAVIDRVNILGATRLAMARALRRLGAGVDYALIDGRDRLAGCVPTCPVIGGDRRSLSIAAASIVAKATRDLIMLRYDATYPGYGFADHKGYPTPRHQDALRRLGPSPIHRRSFRLVY
jgi:ribonuclease HII